MIVVVFLEFGRITERAERNPSPSSRSLKLSLSGFGFRVSARSGEFSSLARARCATVDALLYRGIVVISIIIVRVFALCRDASLSIDSFDVDRGRDSQTRGASRRAIRGLSREHGVLFVHSFLDLIVSSPSTEEFHRNFRSPSLRTERKMTIQLQRLYYSLFCRTEQRTRTSRRLLLRFSRLVSADFAA